MIFWGGAKFCWEPLHLDSFRYTMNMLFEALYKTRGAHGEE